MSTNTAFLVVAIVNAHISVLPSGDRTKHFSSIGNASVMNHVNAASQLLLNLRLYHDMFLIVCYYGDGSGLYHVTLCRVTVCHWLQIWPVSWLVFVGEQFVSDKLCLLLRIPRTEDIASAGGRFTAICHRPRLWHVGRYTCNVEEFC